MSTTPVHPISESPVNYLNESYGIKSWLFTTDHKRIAILYLLSITVMFWIGGFLAMRDPDLFQKDRKKFNQASDALTKAQKELQEAEDKWLELEVLREEIEQA